MTDEGPAGERTYRCPYCPAEYPTEMLARVHVSYADDSRHEGRDGMTPEVEPVECDASGERVGTAFTLAGQLNLHGLSLSDIPAAYNGRTFDERERRALLVAAVNADGDRAETELQDRVTAHLGKHGFEPLSTRELRSLCDHLFRPAVDDETDTAEHGPELTTAETRLRDLTPLQQAIILAHLARPDSERTALATHVGTARSYPTQVIDARPALVARLRSRLERTSPERLVAERVPAEDLDEIREAGYLDAFDIDLASARDRKRRRNDPGGATGSETAPDATGGATPDDTSETASDSEGTARSRSGETKEENLVSDGAAVGSEPAGDGTGDGHGGTDSKQEGIPRAEVAAVREQVAFDLAVVEQEMELADPTPQQVRTKAYLEQILARLDDILS
jgi:hypothetical protein